MKKFRFLSSLLAALMVLSMLTAMPVGAAQIDANTFFCDFESFTEASEAQFTANGFTYALNPVGMTIATDDEYGKCLGFRGSSNGNHRLFFGLEDPVTTGKVRLGFAFKPVSGSAFICTSQELVNGQNNAYMAASASDNLAILGTGSSNNVHNINFTDTQKEWYYVEFVVDVDSNTRTAYLDGEKVYTYTIPSNGSDPLPKLRGFFFYNAASSASSAYSLYDNITVTYEAEDESILEVIDTDFSDNMTQLNMVFSKCVDATKQISVVQCGGTAVDTQSVSVKGNIVTITFNEALQSGCEYMIKLGEDILYVYEPLDEVIENDTGVKDFEDVTTKVYDGRTTEEVSNQYVVGDKGESNGILASHNFSAGSTGYPLVYTTELDSSDTTVGTNNASGKVIYPKAWEPFRLLKPINASNGKEVYEFDFKWTNSGASFDLKTFSDSKLIARVGAANKWKHMRIEYDRATNIATSYVDGVQNQSVETTGFGAMLQFYTNSSDIVFWMDNYRSYVENAPLAVESVRYTAGAETTGANHISPETTKIDITFTEAVKADTLSGIALTADGKTIAPDVDVNGKVVTLNIDMLPANKDVVLTIPTTVTAETGIPLSTARTYAVKTTDTGKFAISGLDIKVNGSHFDGVETTTGTEGANVVVTADVLNTKAVDHDITVIYAFYNDDELVDVWYKDFDLDGKYHLAISETDTSKANITYDKVKVFVWDGLTTRVPKAVSVSYPAN